ncbi:hypothetical protein HN51_027331 [Arachis hypogaea]|uniref:Stomagen C-terminal domain-containing protein n=1 Tax=Arachis hypogaea TaxID=3818 RepID=A0A445BNH1_ARAHY|nr:EPIDERMAL PATTERNING FACTOR-like protein [Arachis hypogaea]RYR40233.1 hypothetical protein Ahy_A09g045950 [Arachis hypogaea]
MGTTKLAKLLLLFFTLLTLATPKVIQGIQTKGLLVSHEHSFSQAQIEQSLKGLKMRNSRRLMIGSTAPTCTYNECRGCKYKCRAEQVPVEGNDPINSPYHYRCVCHR